MRKAQYIVLFLLVVLTSCKNNVVTPVPSTRVSLDFNVLRDAPALNAMGGVATFIVPKYSYQYLGYGGLVVFHNYDDQFLAYDLTCPNEILPSVRVNVDSLPGEAICPQCGTVYDIAYSKGYPVSGPCKYPMRQYNVMVSGYDVHVYN